MDGDSILVVKYSEKNIYSINIADVFHLAGTDIEFSDEFSLPDDVKNAVEESKGAGVQIEDRYEEGRRFEFPATIRKDFPLPGEFTGTELTRIAMGKGMCTYRLPDLGDVKYEVQVSYRSEGQFVTLLDTNELAAGQEIELSLANKIFDLENNKIGLEFNVWLKEGRLTVTLIEWSTHFCTCPCILTLATQSISLEVAL